MAIPASEHKVFIRHAQPAATPAAPWQLIPRLLLLFLNCRPTAALVRKHYSVRVCAHVLYLYVFMGLSSPINLPF